MRKKLTFLGIETSCDETTAAVVRQEKQMAQLMFYRILISSQIDNHEKFGGVVPEVAARSHLENIEFIINKSLDEVSKLKLSDRWNCSDCWTRPCVCLTVGLNIGKSDSWFS